MTQVSERATAPGVAIPDDAPHHILPLLSITVALLLWASAFVVIRHLSDAMSAGGLGLARALVGASVLGAMLGVSRGWRRPTPQELVRILAIGVLWFGVYSVALNAGEQRVDAGTAAMLVQVSPLLITLLAIPVLHERATRRTWAGLLVAFGGVAMITLATTPGVGQDLVGVLLCLVAAAAYSLCVILQKPLVPRLSTFQVTWMACFTGAVACLPFVGSMTRDLMGTSVTQLGWIVYLGVFPTALAFTLYAYALSHMTASRLAATNYLVPPAAVVIAWVALGEAPPAGALLGGTLCLAGVIISRAPDRGRRRPKIRAVRR